MKRLINIISRKKIKELIIGLLLTFLASFFISFQTLLLSAITSSFDNSSNNDINTIVIPLVLMGIFGFVAITLNFIGYKFLVEVSSYSISEYRLKVFNEIQRMKITQNKISIHSLANRLILDVNNVMLCLNTLILNGIPQFFAVVFYVSFSIWVSPLLSTSYLLLFPLVSIITYTKGMRSVPYAEKTISDNDKFNEIIKENVYGYRVVKTFILEEHQLNKFNKINDSLKRNSTNADKHILTMMSTVISLINLFNAVILMVSGISNTYIINEYLTIKLSNIIPFISYSFLSVFSSFEITNAFMYTKKNKVSFDRIDEIIFSKKYSNLTKEQFKYGDIIFDNVSFKYNEELEEKVLSNLNIIFKKNSINAIVGNTGSGKTTLIDLITKIISPTSGKILIGDKNINDIDDTDLRENIGMAFQDKMLFSGTIRENIELGSSFKLTEEDVEWAAEISCSIKFIESKEEGFEYKLVEKGKNLSGGQQQRISIARAVVKKPKILILDDSLSALDNITAKKIFNNLKKEFKNSIIIFISQKVSLAKEADKIIVLDNGKIESIGNHQKVLKDSKIYKSLLEAEGK